MCFVTLMKTKLLYGGMVLLAFVALLFGQATFGPSGGGSSSSNTNGFDSSQFNVSTGGVVTIKDGAVVSNLVGKASATSAKAISTQSGTNFIRDPVRPAVDFSTDPANFAIEIFSDSSGALQIYSADAVTNVAKFDANGLTLQQLYLAPNAGLGGVLAAKNNANTLEIGNTAWDAVKFFAGADEVFNIRAKGVTNVTFFDQAGAQSNYNGIYMIGGQFTGNGAGLTNIPGNFSGTVTGATVKATTVNVSGTITGATVNATSANVTGLATNSGLQSVNTTNTGTFLQSLATASRAAIFDANKQLTNASGTADATHYLDGTGAYSTPASGGGGSFNTDQFSAGTTLTNIKSGALVTNLQHDGVLLLTATNLPGMSNNSIAIISNSFAVSVTQGSNLQYGAALDFDAPVIQTGSGTAGTLAHPRGRVAWIPTINAASSAPAGTWVWESGTNGAGGTVWTTNMLLASPGILSLPFASGTTTTTNIFNGGLYPYHFGNAGWWTDPIALLRPTTPGQSMVLDICPNTNAQGYAQIDICASDVYLNNGAIGTHLLLKAVNGGCTVDSIGSAGNNDLTLQGNSSARNLIIGHTHPVTIYDNLGVVQEAPNGVWFSSVHPIWIENTGSGFLTAVGYQDSSGRRSALEVANNAGGSFSTLKLMRSGGTTLIGSVLTVASNAFFTNAVIVAGPFTNKSTAFIPTNTAPITTVAPSALHSVTLGKGWTNDLGGSATLVISVKYVDAVTGDPSFYFTNSVSGEAWTNSYAFGIAGTMQELITIPGISPNDSGSFTDSSGTGASVTFLNAWWKMTR